MTVRNVNKEEYDVYIGRRGKGKDGYFGNPFEMKVHGRDGCLRLFRIYFYSRIRTDSVFRSRVEELRGKRLGCFCAPERCHGDIIEEYLESICEVI